MTDSEEHAKLKRKIKYWCFNSNGKTYVHTPKKDIPCKTVWDAGKLLYRMRTQT